MDRQPTLFRNKVARRLLLIFLLCALLPIGALSYLALDHVSAELYEQSQQRLHRASKAAALSILARLQHLELELKQLASEWRTSGAAPEGRGERLEQAFTWVAVQTVDGSLLPVMGVPDPLPQGPAGDLAPGRSRLVNGRGPRDAPLVVMEHWIDAGGARLLAGLRIPELLGPSAESSLPARAEFCLLDPALRPLHCSLPEAPGLPPAVLEEMRQSASGQFDWSPQSHGPDYVARYWSLFLQHAFGARAWVLVVAEPREAVFAPIARFRTTFLPAVVGCLLLVSLLSLRQVRRRLAPLEALRAGTRRVSERDFSVDLQVDSDDEFEELAVSFNAMSRRLGQQFESLATMLDIDRSILASKDVTGIVGVLVSRVRDLHPCDSLAVIVRAREAEAPLEALVSRHPEDPGDIVELAEFSSKDSRLLAAHPEHLSLRLDAGVDVPRYLGPLQSAGARGAVAFPLFVQGELAGVIACGHDDPETRDPERLVFVRQLADQASIALANAFTVEENRVLAYFDALTGLPNRLLFRERAEQALAQAQRCDDQIAVCLFDLDGFKHVNDTLGHDAGDRLLKEVGIRVGRVVRSGSLARLGGDEFTVLMRDFDRVDAPARVAQKIVDEVARPFQLDSQEVFVGASVGIAVHPNDGNYLETLLRNADAAMYHAKEGGGGRYRFYTPALHEAALERLHLESDLRKALDRGELRVFYQPVVDVETREIVGAEALVRWQHPDRGLVMPAEFVPLAEETGLVVPVDAHVLRTACQQCSLWQRAGLPPIRVAVNVSSREFRDASLASKVQRVLHETGLDARYLGLEITEGSLVNADSVTQSTLLSLRELGVCLSIDDFGTGYSSLAYLKQFPVDQLKIDRIFVSGVDRDSADAAIVRGVIALAHSMNLSVVAEGVENEVQLAFLRGEGCQEAQGYLFAEPLASDAFEKLLRAQLAA